MRQSAGLLSQANGLGSRAIEKSQLIESGESLVRNAIGVERERYTVLKIGTNDCRLLSS